MAATKEVPALTDEQAALADLLAAILREHEAAEAHRTDWKTHALARGRFCVDAKLIVGHGSWESWVRENLPFSPRTARDHMSLAREAERDRQHAAVSGSMRAFIRANKKASIIPDGDGFRVDPFSVFDTRKDGWQERKRYWKDMGIESEVGDGNLTFGSFDQEYVDDSTQERWGGGSTSIFDPALTEFVYRSFAPLGGRVFDPFAGGPVRGVVASALGHPYLGIELRPAQVAANRKQADDILGPDVPHPQWIEGDSDEVLRDMSGEPDTDLILSSPPYGSLERYSNDPRDLSAMTPAAFEIAYRRILGRAVSRLRDNRFAVLVVGNYRDRKTGNLRDLVGLTCAAMADAGASFYNEGVLINAYGTAPLRVAQQWEGSRKLCRVHQNVLIFVRGDSREAAAAARGEG